MRYATAAALRMAFEMHIKLIGTRDAVFPRVLGQSFHVR